ncbi:MAG: DUF3482 domain-containing protein [Gammaproteobacteria bacterium]|nr:MAG: DUF3482 domain-containing protein [Gammaproteobacteria bacterium]
MAPEVLRVAVVGHTNTGKTSLLRTLLRDTHFGEVRDAPATTRHVEGAQLLVDGRALLALYDTPGLEDAPGILDWLEAHPGDRHEGARSLQRFLDTPEAAGRFEQEAKVLRQLQGSEVGLYVIDAREPVLPKYRDELAVLALCARPLLPVLNFIAGPGTRVAAWREALAELGLHTVIEFDSVVFDAVGERRLFEKLSSVLDQWRGPLGELRAARERDARWRREAATRLAADLLLDVAAAVALVDADDEIARSRDEAALREQVRERERRCTDQVIELFAFGGVEYAVDALPLEDGRWHTDLFTPEALGEYGLKAGRGAGVGAAAGLAVDALSAGLTLGVGTLTGAMLGALFGDRHGLGRRLFNRVRGYRELRVDDATLRLLALRQRRLLRALERRGHGAVAPLDTTDELDERWRSASLPRVLLRARARPEWSALNRHRAEAWSAPAAGRDEACVELAAQLGQALDPAGADAR